MSQRTLARWATAALATAAFVATGTSSARADYSITPIRGCWGVGVAVCDPTVTVHGISPSTWNVPVCTGTCEYYPVPFVSLDGGLYFGVCGSYSTPNGGGVNTCFYASYDNANGLCVDPEGIDLVLDNPVCVGLDK